MDYLITNVCPRFGDLDFEAFLDLQREMLHLTKDEAHLQYLNRTSIKCSLLLLAKSQDRPVGSLLAIDNYPEKPPIVRLDGAVHPQHRRKRIMSAMTQIVEWWAGHGGWEYSELSPVLNPLAERFGYTNKSGIYRKKIKETFGEYDLKIPFETRLSWEIKETLVDKIAEITFDEGCAFIPDACIIKIEQGQIFRFNDHNYFQQCHPGDIVEVGLNYKKDPAWLYDPGTPLHFKKKEIV